LAPYLLLHLVVVAVVQLEVDQIRKPRPVVVVQVVAAVAVILNLEEQELLAKEIQVANPILVIVEEEIQLVVVVELAVLALVV
jgi:hypothetical protein